MKEALEWAQDQDSKILDALPVTELLGPEVNVKDAGRQLYAVLAQLCEGEALDLVQNVVNSDGWEAWRILSRRIDPQGAGRKRSVTSQLLQAGAFDPQDLNSAIDNEGEKNRMYERRAQSKLPTTSRAASPRAR